MKNRASTFLARLVLGTLAVAFLAPFAWLSYRAHSRLVELEQGGLESSGHVTRTQCKNHGRVNYSFAVSGKTYGGQGACLASCVNARAGDLVDVLYAQGNPENSTCDSLSDLRDKVRGNYVGLVLGVVVLFVLIYSVTRRKGLELS